MAIIKSVVRETAALLVEVIVTTAQRVEKVREARDGDVCAGGETVNPSIEGLRIVGTQGAVRPEGWIDACFQLRSRDAAMIFEAVSRIIGGADCAYLEALEDPLCGEFVVAGQESVGPLPDLGSSVFVEQLVDSEIALQLEVGPMIERIAQGVRHSAGPGEKLFIGLRVAGAITL